MVVEKEFNIGPFKAFLGKVILREPTEWFFIENYSLKDLSLVLDKYFYIIGKEYADTPNLEHLFHVLCIFHTALIRRAPEARAVLNNIVVMDRYVNENGKDVIKVKYFYDKDVE